MTTVTAAELRQNVYRLLDHVLDTGEPLEVERNGRRVRIAAVDPGSRVDRIRGFPDLVVGDSDDLVHIDWSAYWHP